MKDHFLFAGLFTVSMAAALGNRWILLALAMVFLVGWLFTLLRDLRKRPLPVAEDEPRGDGG